VPELDADSAAALTERDGADQPPPEHRSAPEGRIRPDFPEPSQAPDQPPAVLPQGAGDDDPLAALLAALGAAGGRGAKVAELAHAVGRAKTWVYERLQELHRQGQVGRAGHGRWRVISAPDSHDAGAPDDHDE